jgi:hypothetical protein
MEVKVFIKIEESSLFGDVDLDDINVPESINKFKELATKSAEVQFPGANIVCLEGSFCSGDEVLIDGIHDEDASEALRVLTGEIFSDFNWVVYRDPFEVVDVQKTPIQEKILDQFKAVETWADEIVDSVLQETGILYINCKKYDPNKKETCREKIIGVKPSGEFIVLCDKVLP